MIIMPDKVIQIAVAHDVTYALTAEGRVYVNAVDDGGWEEDILPPGCEAGPTDPVDRVKEWIKPLEKEGQALVAEGRKEDIQRLLDAVREFVGEIGTNTFPDPAENWRISANTGEQVCRIDSFHKLVVAMQQASKALK